jgi:predicted RNA-binding Zn-ribbon protein involved in translation (DUF1610 family)
MDYRKFKDGFIGNCVLCDSASIESLSDKNDLVYDCPKCGKYIFRKDAYTFFSNQKTTDFIFYKHLRYKLCEKVKSYTKKTSHVYIDTNNLRLI